MSASGYPLWARTADISEYGISTSTTNYAGIGVVNPKTDQGAAGAMRMADHLASCARTAAIAVLQYTQDDTTPANPTVNVARCAWAIASSSYAGGSPPTNFPSVTRIGDGHCRVTFDTSYSDDFGVSASLNLAGGTGGCNDNDSVTVEVKSVNAYTVDVYCFDSASGAAATDKSVTVEIV